MTSVRDTCVHLFRSAWTKKKKNVVSRESESVSGWSALAMGPSVFFPPFLSFFFFAVVLFRCSKRKKKKNERARYWSGVFHFPLLYRSALNTRRCLVCLLLLLCVWMCGKPMKILEVVPFLFSFFFFAVSKNEKKKSYSNDPVRVKWRGNGVFVSAVLLLCLLWLG